MTPVLTDAQLAQFHNDGFVVLPKFASDEACLALRERAMQLAKDLVPSPEQATIFTADSTATHAADQYFLTTFVPEQTWPRHARPRPSIQQVQSQRKTCRIGKSNRHARAEVAAKHVHL